MVFSLKADFLEFLITWCEAKDPISLISVPFAMFTTFNGLAVDYRPVIPLWESSLFGSFTCFEVTEKSPYQSYIDLLLRCHLSIELMA